MNKKFFEDLMKDRQISLRKVAAHIDLAPSQLSRTFTGHRRMQLNEAAALAKLLGANIVDVMFNAGIESAKAGVRYAKVIGHVNAEMAVVENTAAERVQLPVGLPDDTEALQARTANTELSFIDGWLYFIGPPMRPIEGVGSFCVVQLGDRQVLGCLSKGYQAGTYNVIMPSARTLQSKTVSLVRRIYFTQHL